MNIPRDRMFWRGRAIEDYTKEELIEIIRQQNDMYVEAMAQKRRDMEALFPRGRDLR